MKRLAILLLCCLPSTLRGATINAASASQADVQAAINTAVSGDTVAVPAGSATWSTQVTLPAGKNITLQGAGVGSTIITATGYRAIEIASGSRVTGFSITANSANPEIIKVDAHSSLRWRVDHCTLTGSGSSSLKQFYILGDSTRGGQPFGVVDNCTWVNVRMNIIGSSPLYAWDMWSAAEGLGTDRYVYVEDCTISTTTYWNFIDVNWGGRYVVRFNTITNAYCEVHGNQGDTSRGVRAWEIYGNTFVYTGAYQGFANVHFIRSGTGVVFSNTVTSSGSPNLMTTLGIDVRRAAAGISLGGNFRDGNDPIPSQGSGTHTGANGAIVLTDGTKAWTANSLTAGRTLSTAYGTFNPAFWIYNTTTSAKAVIGSHTANTVTASLSGGSRQTWNTGDTYEITGGHWSRDQIGRSTDDYLGNEFDWPPQASSPAYWWANTFNGSPMAVSIRNNCQFWLIEGRDYYTSAGAKPGYTSYTYPHPLRGEGGGGPTGVLNFSPVTYSVSESGTNVTIYVHRSDGSSGAATVDFATANATALAGTHYTATNNTLSWLDGDTADKTFIVSVIGNTNVEGNLAFTIDLTNATGAALGTLTNATVTIVDDDFPSPTEPPLMAGLSWQATNGLISLPFLVTNGVVRHTAEKTNPVQGGSASYRFTIPTLGAYVILADVNGADGSANSFFVAIDAEPIAPTCIWSFTPTSGVQQRVVGWEGEDPVEGPQFHRKWWLLTAGEHYLIIRGREAGAELESITIAPATSGSGGVGGKGF